MSPKTLGYVLQDMSPIGFKIHVIHSTQYEKQP